MKKVKRKKVTAWIARRLFVLKKSRRNNRSTENQARIDAKIKIFADVYSSRKRN